MAMRLWLNSGWTMVQIWQPQAAMLSLHNDSLEDSWTQRIHFTIKELPMELFHRLCGSHQDFLDAKAGIPVVLKEAATKKQKLLDKAPW